jgi:hypothetical protein
LQNLPDIIGTVATYADLRALVAARRKELGLSQLDVDEIAGVQSGYTGKVECGTRHFGDLSFGAILGALGLTVGVMRAAGAHGNSCDVATASIERLKINRKKLSAKGGRATARNLTAEQRRAAARKAAVTRWRDWRAVKAEQKRKSKRKGVK